MLDLAETLDLLRSYDARLVSRDDLESALAERVMTAPAADEEESTPPSDAQALAFHIAEAICSDQGPEESVRLFTQRVLQCTGQVTDPGDVLDLLPLIKHHDEFSVLVAKHARGLISVNGMRAVIGKRFRFDAVQEPLQGASIAQLEVLCDAVEANDYHRLRSLLSTM